MGLQVAFLIAVPGASSFVTLGSIGVSFLSFVFAVFAKRNLRDGIDADAGGAGIEIARLSSTDPGIEIARLRH